MWTDYPTPPEYDLAVVIGRFQPFHNGHLSVLRHANRLANTTLVLVGSSNQARSIKNPFSFTERKTMIEYVAKSNSFKNVEVAPLEDLLYNDQQWIAMVQEAVIAHAGHRAKVVLVGHHSDESSWYLDMFPTYEQFEVPQTETMHSTIIREIYFDKQMIPVDVMPQAAEFFLKNFMNTEKETFTALCDEFKFNVDYKAKHKYAGGLPYDPILVTTDAVVINNGHILLVKRRMIPGKGLWALPGGFLGINERIEDSMIRELEEETRIKIPHEKLKQCIKESRVFDHPNRSTRGRTITHAYLIVLNEKKNPKVRGSDDAERARWIPLPEFIDMPHMMYEDHFSIAANFIQRT